MKRVTKKIFRCAIAAGLLLAGAGCGKQAFVVTSTTAEQSSPGNFYIPPKVDILLVEDDTGSMYEAYKEVSVQVPAFLDELQAKGWDYHFAVVPLTNKSTPINELMASKHDANWGDEWTPAHPAATREDKGYVAASLFRKPGEFTEFIQVSDISNSTNGMENGFESIRDAYERRLKDSGFLRDDAMLVTFVLSNGDDTSGVTFCTRSVDGLTVACEDAGQASKGTKASSFETYRKAFLNVKAKAPSLHKFYSAVAANRRTNCLGGSSSIGSRYMQMSTALGGQSYDLCTQPITSIMSALADNLASEKKTFRTRYLFVEQQPDPASIQVVRYVGGSAEQTEIIPQSETDGWTYAGYVENVHAIDAPVPMNLTSGYAIELHGSAKLIGEDRAHVTFKPYGAEDSAEK